MKTLKKESATSNDIFSIISNRKLLALYSAMLQCRGLAEGIVERKRAGHTGSGIKSILGYEAVVVGASIDLRPTDTVACELWPETLFKTINTSVSFTREILTAVREPVSSGTGGQNVTIVFSGSQRTFEAPWRKMLDLAATRNLPIVFMRLHRQAGSKRKIEHPYIPVNTKGYAFPSINVDGTDVVAVYRVASEAITRARKGHGATLIECLPGDALDPIQHMEAYLGSKGRLEPANKSGAVRNALTSA